MIVILTVAYESAQAIGMREEQQDSFSIHVSGPDQNEEPGTLAVVCDGMGGMPLGRESSQLAVEAFIDAYRTRVHGEGVIAALTRSAFAANGAVLEMAAGSGFRGNAGTTLVAAAVEGRSLYWISVGDSRIYLFRDGLLEALNRGHNVAARLENLVRQGRLSAEDASSHPRPDALTSFIGIDVLEEVDLPEGPAATLGGDIVLLCTDGLYNFMTNEEIRNILISAPEDAVRGYTAGRIVGDACRKRSPFQDNITVLLLRIEEKN